MERQNIDTWEIQTDTGEGWVQEKCEPATRKERCQQATERTGCQDT